MPFQIDFKLFEEAISKTDVPQIQSVFENLISDLSNYLGIDPIDKNINITRKEE